MKDNLDIYLHLRRIWLSKWSILVFTFIVTSASYITTFFLPKTYESSATLLIEKPISAFGISLPPRTPLAYKEIATAPDTISIVLDTLKKDKLIPEENFNSQSFSKIASARLTSNNTVLNLKIKGSSPAQIKKIADIWAGTTVKITHSLTLNRLKKTHQSFLNDIISAKKSIEQNQSALKKLTETKNSKITTHNKQVDLANEKRNRLHKLNQERERNLSKISLSKQNSAHLKEQANLLKNWPRGNLSRNTLGNLDTRLITNQLDLIKLRLNKKEAEAAYRSASKTIELLEKSIDNLGNENLTSSLGLGDINKQITEIKNKITVDENKLIELKAKEHNTELSNTLNSPDAIFKVLSSAPIPITPSSPKTIEIILLSLIIGIFSSATWVLIKPFIDDIIHVTPPSAD